MKLFIKPVGPIGTNCYIAADDTGACAVIDPGAEPTRLLEALKDNGLTPAVVLLTHGHYDHIGAVKAITAKYGCPLVIGAEDAQMLADPKKSLAGMSGMPVEDYIMTPDRLVKQGDVVQAGALSFQVIEAPGHTLGGVCYMCEDCLFTGDTLFQGTVGRVDHFGGDHQALLASVAKLKAIEGDFRVLAGHGPDSTLERERQYNPFMRTLSDDDFY